MSFKSPGQPRWQSADLPFSMVFIFEVDNMQCSIQINALVLPTTSVPGTSTQQPTEGPYCPGCYCPYQLYHSLQKKHFLLCLRCHKLSLLKVIRVIINVSNLLKVSSKPGWTFLVTAFPFRFSEVKLNPPTPASPRDYSWAGCGTAAAL